MSVGSSTQSPEHILPAAASLLCISVVYLTTVVVKDSIIHPVGAVSHLASDKPSDSDFNLSNI